MLKISSEATANILQKLLNESLENSTFPDSLTLADITPVFKKKDPLDKTNYLTVSVLPILSKLFEKIMQKQVNGFIIIVCHPIYVVTEKVITRNRLY